MYRLIAFAAWCGFAAAALGQNVVKNGSFSQFSTTDNLWDGVDGKQYLAGFTRDIYAVTESGRVGGLPMPISVNFVDVNADKLPDIVAADPFGVVRAYINGGTATVPKWTHAEVIPIFPPQIARADEDRGYWAAYGVPKLAMFDWDRRGAPDFIVGNYTGDILMIPNTGSNQAPVFAQPTHYERIRIPTSAKNKPWGNLFAPCAFDFNKDGKPDLLVGEGTYSANAVYLLLNKGGGQPKFAEGDRTYLCYGDGREQLVPTVADYNGDGLPDVLAGDRKGTVGVYLNRPDWKPGEELKFASYITFGNSTSLGNSSIAPYACDYNGDGLFDLLIGKTNGRIALAANIGKEREPKFAAPTELTGADLMIAPLNAPAGWTFDVGHGRANLYAYCTVDAEETSPDGGKVLKCGYYPSPNQVFKLTPLGVDGRDGLDYFHYHFNVWYPTNVRNASDRRPTEQFLIRQELAPLKPGTTYTLSFRVRGANVRDGIATVAILGAAENVPKKFQKNERGAVVKALKNEAYEQILETEMFSGTPQWRRMEKTFTFNFREKSVKQLTESTHAMLEFKFLLPQYAATCDICDVQLVAKPAK